MKTNLLIGPENRKYRFVYESKLKNHDPQEHYYYTIITPADIIGYDLDLTEPNYMIVANRYFMEEINDQIDSERPPKNYTLKRVEMVPYHEMISDTDVVKNVMEQYMNDADSMSELLCFMIQEENLIITMEEMEYLLHWAGDADVLCPEDIWDMVQPKIQLDAFRYWLRHVNRAEGVDSTQINAEALRQEKQRIDTLIRKEIALHGNTEHINELQVYHDVVDDIWCNSILSTDVKKEDEYSPEPTGVFAEYVTEAAEHLTDPLRTQVMKTMDHVDYETDDPDYIANNPEKEKCNLYLLQTHGVSVVYYTPVKPLDGRFHVLGMAVTQNSTKIPAQPYELSMIIEKEHNTNGTLVLPNITMELCTYVLHEICVAIQSAGIPTWFDGEPIFPDEIWRKIIRRPTEIQVSE